MEKSECRFEDSVVRYSVKGSGPALVLLHGFCEDSTVWHQLIDQFPADKFRLLLPDLPGFGSSLLSQQTELSMIHMAGAVNAMLEKEGIQKCVMLGHSMGGYVALEFAATHPQKLSGLGLLHSTAAADDEDKKKNRLHAIRFIEDNGMEAYTRATGHNLFSTGARSEVLFRDFYLMMRSCRPGTAMAATRAMMDRKDRTHILRSASYPVLFIAGRHDHLIALDKLLSQAAEPAVADVNLLEHSAHMGLLEEAEKTAEFIIKYMEFTASFSK